MLNTCNSVAAPWHMCVPGLGADRAQLPVAWLGPRLRLLATVDLAFEERKLDQASLDRGKLGGIGRHQGGVARHSALKKSCANVDFFILQ